MINKNKNNYKSLVQLAGLVVGLIMLTGIYVWWSHYLHNHFFGAFDMYGLPSQFFRNGWFMMLDAWPLWVVPSLFWICIALGVAHWIQLAHHMESSENSDVPPKAVLEKTNKKNHQSMSFNHALEIETLKQQVDILKTKYFSEHQRANELAQTMDEEIQKAKQSIEREFQKKQVAHASNASNAHQESVISTLRAENKTLQSQLNEIQEELLENNALVEKILGDEQDTDD